MIQSMQLSTQFAVNWVFIPLGGIMILFIDNNLSFGALIQTKTTGVKFRIYHKI